MKSGSLKDIINTYYMDTLTKTKQYCNQNIFFQSLITLHTKCISNCPSLEKVNFFVQQLYLKECIWKCDHSFQTLEKDVNYP